MKISVCEHTGAIHIDTHLELHLAILSESKYFVLGDVVPWNLLYDWFSQDRVFSISATTFYLPAVLDILQFRVPIKAFYRFVLKWKKKLINVVHQEPQIWDRGAKLIFLSLLFLTNSTWKNNLINYSFR